MGDERYRIRADELDDYSLRPDGVELSAGHDSTPPPDALPMRVTPMSSASTPAGLSGLSSVASSGPPRRRRLARAYAWWYLVGGLGISAVAWAVSFARAG